MQLWISGLQRLGEQDQLLAGRCFRYDSLLYSIYVKSVVAFVEHKTRMIAACVGRPVIESLF